MVGSVLVKVSEGSCKGSGGVKDSLRLFSPLNLKILSYLTGQVSIARP